MDMPDGEKINLQIVDTGGIEKFKYVIGERGIPNSRQLRISAFEW